MQKVDNILADETFRHYLKKIKKKEKDRQFCKHNLRHLLDVARIAYIMSLEQKLAYSKEVIYASALLHDIGKNEQYLYGIPHEQASAKIAPDILKRAGFSDDEIETIVKVILAHRTEKKDKKSLEYIMYKADKLSRNCFWCKAEKECNWKAEKKNEGIIC